MKGVWESVDGEKVRTRDLPTSKPQKDTATRIRGLALVRYPYGGMYVENKHIGVTPTKGAETPA